MSAYAEINAWCGQRGHPWVTYNSWLDKTWCRCGSKVEAGAHPIDLQAVLEENSPDRLRQLERYVLGKLATTDDPQVIADATEHLASIRQALTSVELDATT
jgi:hypothetical protein